MVRVLGRANSINVQKVMWMAAEIGLDVERIDIGGAFGGNDQADYLAKNPNGRVPTLEDGDFVLWESNSIVRYLAEKYGSSPWLPAKIEDKLAKFQVIEDEWSYAVIEDENGKETECFNSIYLSTNRFK